MAFAVFVLAHGYHRFIIDCNVQNLALVLQVVYGLHPCVVMVAY